MADFLADVRKPTGTANLPLDLSIEVPAGSKVRERLQRFGAPLQTQEAELRVRIGEPTRALELVRAARASCPRCVDLLDRQARVAYRAFEPDLATELAHGPSKDAWGPTSKLSLIAHLRTVNDAIAKADGPERLQLEMQRAAEVGLPAVALRLLERLPTDPALLRLRLHFAALAGDADAAQRYARELGITAPAMPPSISPERIREDLSQLKVGCAFPDELE
jgi:hypothetical protein